jgi:hypothetical protein
MWAYELFDTLSRIRLADNLMHESLSGASLGGWGASSNLTSIIHITGVFHSSLSKHSVVHLQI